MNDEDSRLDTTRDIIAPDSIIQWYSTANNFDRGVSQANNDPPSSTHPSPGIP